MCSNPNHNHSVDWAYQNKLNAEWKAANPDAKSSGWWSI